MTDIGDRAFDFEKDLADVKRIWREVGWTEDENDEKQLDHFFAVGSTHVGTMNGVPECSVHITPGTMRLLETDLDLCAVTAVTTGRIARGFQFAQRITAKQLQQGALSGAAVAALGMFDQGFYDKLGFGTGSYDHEFQFDPGTLDLRVKPGVPERLGHDDFEDMHSALCHRPRNHGAATLQPKLLFKAEVGFEEDAFGLGYREAGELTHFVWLEPEGERGPYRVRWLGYRDMTQLLELFALLKSLADQVYSVKLVEPAGMQLQALLKRPFRERTLTRNSQHTAFHRSVAWWQLRILDLQPCVAALRWWLPDGLRCNLELEDPVGAFLDSGDWRGLTGSYVLDLGEQCSVETGVDAELPTLQCSVNALSRLLWGVGSATSLAVTDDLSAPPELLSKLDAGLRIPSPCIGWDF